MPRPKKDGHYINCYLDASVYDTLCRYADDVGQTKTLAIERILKQFFEANGYDLKAQENQESEE